MIKTPSPESHLAEQQTDIPYLQVQLDRETLALVPMKDTQEVLTVPSNRITVMPNMSDCILGLLNQRSRVIWAVDLPQMLEKQPIDRNLQKYQMTIIRVNNSPLGLVLPRIQGIIRLSAAAIQSPVGNIAPGLISYLQGCYLHQERVLLVLDAEAIVNSPLLERG